MITNAGRQWLLNFLRGNPGPGINYLALGTSDIPAQAGDIALTAEGVRKVVTNIYQDEWAMVYEVFFERNEANFSWREVGLFAGGTATPGSGILIARALINEDKDEMKTATVTMEIIL